MNSKEPKAADSVCHSPINGDGECPIPQSHIFLVSRNLKLDPLLAEAEMRWNFLALGCHL